MRPSSPTSQQIRRRRLQVLPALLAWLLLAIQLPWHAGMQAGSHTPDYAQLASTLGITCGPAPDAGTLAALVDAGLVDPEQLATHGDDGSLCKLFTGLVAPLDAIVAFTAATNLAKPLPVARADLAAFPPAFRQPPARAPPALPA